MRLCTAQVYTSTGSAMLRECGFYSNPLGETTEGLKSVSKSKAHDLTTVLLPMHMYTLCVLIVPAVLKRRRPRDVMLFDGLYQSCTEKRRCHSLTSNCLSFMNNTSMVSKNDNIINVLHHLKELKNDRDLVVLSADKVNAADIMDTLKYEDKMTNFLSDESTYRLLEKDPTP